MVHAGLIFFVFNRRALTDVLVNIRRLNARAAKPDSSVVWFFLSFDYLCSLQKLI